MKKIFILGALLFITSIPMVSCTDDDDKDPNYRYFDKFEEYKVNLLGSLYFNSQSLSNVIFHHSFGKVIDIVPFDD